MSDGGGVTIGGDGGDGGGGGGGNANCISRRGQPTADDRDLTDWRVGPHFEGDVFGELRMRRRNRRSKWWVG